MRMTFRTRLACLAALAAFLTLTLACSGRITFSAGPVVSTPGPATSGPGVGPGPGGGFKVNPSPTTPDPGNQPDIEMTDEQFANEFVYAEDKWAAEKKYKDRFLKVTGVVAGYGYGLKGEPFLQLVGSKDARFNVDEKLLAKKVLPGQSVTLRGKAKAFDSQWEIVNVTGKGPPELTAELLAKEFAADPAGTNKKYDKKMVVLTGKLYEVKGGLQFTPDKATPRIYGWYQQTSPEAQKERTQAFKVGNTVRVVGWYQATGDAKMPSFQIGMIELINVVQ
jgi:hypothetical protein